MRKILMAVALAATGLSLSGCWHGHDRGWGDHNPGHGDHGHGDGGNHY